MLVMQQWLCGRAFYEEQVFQCPGFGHSERGRGNEVSEVFNFFLPPTCRELTEKIRIVMSV